MSILVVGSVAYDDVETPSGRRENVLGGAATHFSVAASFFTDIRLVAVVGNDFEDEHINFLKSRNVCLKGLQVVNGKTFRWKGKYGNALNEAQNLDTQLGVFADFKPVLPVDYRKSDYVFLACIHPELQLDVLRQIENPKFVACDTRDFWITGNPAAVKEVIKKRVDIFFLNDIEARLLSGEQNLVRAAEGIRKMGPKIVVIKRGEHGALLFTENGIFNAPAMPLKNVLDPTGAGDSFAGGFVGYLAKTKSLDEQHLRRAVICGSTMASFNVEDFSLDRLRTLTWTEIEERMQAFKDLSHFEL